MVCPNDHGDSMLSKYLRGRRIIFRGDDDHRRPIAPLMRKRKYLIGHRECAVDENSIGARLPVRFSSPQGLCQPPATDERLDSRNDAEIVIDLRILTRLDLAAELLHIRKRLRFTF